MNSLNPMISNSNFNVPNKKILSKKCKITILSISIFVGLFSAGIGGVCLYKYLKRRYTNTQSIPSSELYLTPLQKLNSHLEDNEKLIQSELNALLQGNTAPLGWYHEKQEAGGLCGKHAINNALGVQIENSNFKKKVITMIQEELNLLTLRTHSFFT